MKKAKIFVVAFIALLAASNTKAQEFSVNTDIVSSYVWRGSLFSGPSIQPTLNFSTGGFSVGSWGSAGFDEFLEMDLYAKYAFNFGLTVGLTDYYYPKGLLRADDTGHKYFDYSKETGAHGFEANLGYTIKGLSLSANYMINEAGGAATVGGDKYFEASYAFKKFTLFAGAGDGWHTPDGEFAVVNVGISASKDIKITDSFSIPFKVSAIVNPKTEQFFLVGGITF
ncbi:MAG: hypothetical protein QM751_14885 [Paludibacteraceae bacterium]